MAYPSIATYSSNFTIANATSTSITAPSGTAAGDLVILFITVDGTSDISTPTDWTQLAENNSGGQSHAIYYRQLTGALSNFTVTHASEQSSWICVRIPSGDVPVINTVATGSSTTPNATSLTSGFAANTETLYLSCAGWDYNRSASGFPSNMTLYNYSSVSTSTGASGTAIAGVESTAASFDPSNFTMGASDTWAAYTIAVKTAPVNVTIEPPAATTSTVSANLIFQDYIEIQRKTGSGGTYAMIQFLTDTSATTWADTTAESGNTYYYRVRRIRAGTAEAWSNEDDATYTANPDVTVTLLGAATATASATNIPEITYGVGIEPPAATTSTVSAEIPSFILGVGVEPPAATTSSVSAEIPTLNVGVLITGEVATATSSAELPTISAEVNISTSPPEATATSSAEIPEIRYGITVEPPASTSTASAPLPELSIGSSITAATGEATASAEIPEITTTVVTTIEPPAATATASLEIPEINYGSSTQSVAATATGSAEIPEINYGSTISPPAATATASLEIPTVSTEVITTIEPPAATTTASAELPTLITNSQIEPPAATTTASAELPTLSAGTQIEPPVSTTTASAEIPSIYYGVTVSPPEATVTASLEIPTISAGGSITVEPPVSTATGSAELPTINYGLTISPPEATATSSAELPTILVGTSTTVEPPAATATGSAEVIFQDYIEIQRKTGSGGTYAMLQFLTNVSATTWVDNYNLESGNTYYYRVRRIRSGVAEDWSYEANATVSNITNVQVDGVTATATASAQLPTISITVETVVNPPAAAATASALVPSLKIGLTQDTSSKVIQLFAPAPDVNGSPAAITPPAAIAQASAPIPTILIQSADVQVDSVTATATASDKTPSLKIGLTQDTTSKVIYLNAFPPTAGSGNTVIEVPAATATAASDDQYALGDGDILIQTPTSTTQAATNDPQLQINSTLMVEAAVALASAYASVFGDDIAIEVPCSNVTAVAFAPQFTLDSEIEVPTALATARAYKIYRGIHGSRLVDVSIEEMNVGISTVEMKADVKFEERHVRIVV